MCGGVINNIGCVSVHDEEVRGAGGMWCEVLRVRKTGCESVGALKRVVVRALPSLMALMHPH